MVHRSKLESIGHTAGKHFQSSNWRKIYTHFAPRMDPLVYGSQFIRMQLWFIWNCGPNNVAVACARLVVHEYALPDGAGTGRLSPVAIFATAKIVHKRIAVFDHCVSEIRPENWCATKGADCSNVGGRSFSIVAAGGGWLCGEWTPAELSAQHMDFVECAVHSFKQHAEENVRRPICNWHKYYQHLRQLREFALEKCLGIALCECLLAGAGAKCWMGFLRLRFEFKCFGHDFRCVAVYCRKRHLLQSKVRSFSIDSHLPHSIWY